jgi:hypothetical protein
MHHHDTALRIETDARAFMRQLDEWDGDSLPFRACVMTAMLHLLLFHEKDVLADTLAAEFEVPTGTVFRWANGTVKPHILVQRRVVVALRRELEIALTPSCAA